MNASFRKKSTPFLKRTEKERAPPSRTTGQVYWLCVWPELISNLWNGNRHHFFVRYPNLVESKEIHPSLPCLAQWVGSFSCPRVGSIQPRSPPVALGCWWCTLFYCYILQQNLVYILKKKISFIAYACRQYFHHPARNSASKVNARLGELSNSAVSLALDYAYLVIHEPGQNISSQQKGVSIHN